MTLHHPLPMPINKILSAKTIKYILKCWERSVKRKSNISFRVIKNSSFDQSFLMVKTFLKILWWQFLVPSSEHLLGSSATLLCMTQNILTLSMLVYYNTNSFFLRCFSLMFLTFVLLCNFITSKYSFFRRIIQVWYQYFQIGLASFW